MYVCVWSFDPYCNFAVMKFANSFPDQYNHTPPIFDTYLLSCHMNFNMATTECDSQTSKGRTVTIDSIMKEIGYETELM